MEPKTKISISDNSRMERCPRMWTRQYVGGRGHGSNAQIEDQSASWRASAAQHREKWCIQKIDMLIPVSGYLYRQKSGQHSLWFKYIKKIIARNDFFIQNYLCQISYCPVPVTFLATLLQSNLMPSSLGKSLAAALHLDTQCIKSAVTQLSLPRTFS